MLTDQAIAFLDTLTCDNRFKGQKTGAVMVIVDANELGNELLGISGQLRSWLGTKLLSLVADNPAGQSCQFTPFILVRESA